jgi:hypothetical protein
MPAHVHPPRELTGQAVCDYNQPARAVKRLAAAAQAVMLWAVDETREDDRGILDIC